MITWAFKFLFLYVYYLPTLLMKLACLIPTKAKKDGQGFTVLGITVSAQKGAGPGKFFYNNLDAICFFMLNLSVAIFVCIAWWQASVLKTDDSFKFYENGVYLKHLAANL